MATSLGSVSRYEPVQSLWPLGEKYTTGSRRCLLRCLCGNQGCACTPIKMQLALDTRIVHADFVHLFEFLVVVVDPAVQIEEAKA